MLCQENETILSKPSSKPFSTASFKISIKTVATIGEHAEGNMVANVFRKVVKTSSTHSEI